MKTLSIYVTLLLAFNHASCNAIKTEQITLAVTGEQCEGLNKSRCSSMSGLTMQWLWMKSQDKCVSLTKENIKNCQPIQHPALCLRTQLQYMTAFFLTNEDANATTAMDINAYDYSAIINKMVIASEL